MQLLLPHTRGLLLSRPRAFREDASSVLTSVRQPAPATATDTTPQPLWKKPSFPFVALIALTTLPFDLAATRQSGAPPRRAKPTTAGTAKSGPAPDIAAVRQQAAVAAAAAGQGHSSAASSAAGAGPAVDSWDAAGGDVSDEDAEQQAKAMVIELLTNPKDTEAALMRAAAAGEGGGDGGAEGAGLSVSPEYIDALVEAAREPTMGMPHHHEQPPPAPKEDTKSRPGATRPWSSNSSSNTSSQEEF